MNYNLDDIQKVKRGQIDFDIKIGLPYGEMPPEALMSKFEMTNDNIDCDEAYDIYARDTLIDRSPDRPTFAHEEQRRSFRGKDYLRLLHEGGRGGTNFVGQPEAFLELTEKDPRGIATDPDYKQLKKQHEARMRFHRFSADADNSITGGGWNEGQVQKAKLDTAFKGLKPRLRIFTTSKDGRREGLNRRWQVKSEVTKVYGQSDSYGDAIKDYALNPQRATVKLSNEVLRNQRLYQLFTPDHEFQVARYGDARRTAQRLTKPDNKKDNTDMDYEFNDDDVSRCYKAAGVLMGKIVNQKKDSESDSQYGNNAAVVARKNELAQIQRDLTLIVRNVQQDADTKEQDQTMTTKTATPQLAEHTKRVVDTNHLTPAHVQLNGELMYKAVMPGADVNKIREKMVVDPADPNICEAVKESRTKYGKNAKRNIDPSARYSIYDVHGKMMKTHSYKHARSDMNTNAKNNVVDEPYAVADYRQDASGMILGDDNSHVRGSTRSNYTNPAVNTDATDVDFNENTSKERRLGPMKDKFKMNRYIQRDSVNNSLSDLS